MHHQKVASAAERLELTAYNDYLYNRPFVQFAEPGDEALLLSMGILPGWRGQGLGQRFVGWVLGALASEGYGSVSLLVGSDNTRALRIYREVGFDVVREGFADPMTADAGTPPRTNDWFSCGRPS